MLVLVIRELYPANRLCHMQAGREFEPNVMRIQVEDASFGKCPIG